MVSNVDVVFSSSNERLSSLQMQKSAPICTANINFFGLFKQIFATQLATRVVQQEPTEQSSHIILSQRRSQRLLRPSCLRVYVSMYLSTIAPRSCALLYYIIKHLFEDMAIATSGAREGGKINIVKINFEKIKNLILTQFFIKIKYSVSPS